MPIEPRSGYISARNMAAELPEVLGRFIGRLANFFFFGEEDDFICLVAATSKFCQ